MMYFAYHIRVISHEHVRCEKRDPQGHLLGEPNGRLSYGKKVQVRVQELHLAARNGQIDEGGIKELGEILFTTLFDSGLRYDFLNFYENARGKDLSVRIELDINPNDLPEIAALPWEFLRLPTGLDHGTKWFSTVSDIIFTRRQTQWFATKPIQLRPGEPLLIALVVSAPQPEILGHVMYEEIWSRLQALEQEKPGKIKLLPLVNPATTESIDSVLGKKPHVLHFIGHARLSHSGQQVRGEIALVDDLLDEPIWIGAERFGELLNRSRPQVILLQACESAAFLSEQPPLGITAQVIAQNIPVIVGMQYEISNSAALRFARKFYECLVEA